MLARSVFLATIASLLFVPLLADNAAAQSSTRIQYGTQTQGSTTRGSTTRGVETFESKFWRYLTNGQVKYDEWGAFPGHEGGLYEGQSPHGAFLKLVANKVARENAATLPHGSIIIKENYTPEKKLAAITVMYRSKGFDAKHNDWYWIKYNPDGSVARTPADKGNMRIAGRFQSCIDCHSGAEGNDFSFAND